MKSNTTRTIVGFMRAWLKRRTPLFGGYSTLDEVYNYVPIHNLFPTSGQPSEAELEQICEAGFNTVINLAPTSVLENSVVAEEDILNKGGVNYVHLPVDFKNPTDTDFERFVNVLEEAGTDNTWVHCAANMRVSAFVYRYRTTVLNEDEAIAKTDLHRIWEPFGVWKNFIGE